MLPINISFPGQNANAIAATQSITATAGGGVILNGSFSPGPGVNQGFSATTASGSSRTQPVVLPGVARPVTVFATTSATNCIFTVIGLNLRGASITATFFGASGGGATATDPNSVATSSGTDFHIIQGVVSSASVGNFTVGFGATGVTNWWKTSQSVGAQALSVGAIFTVTGATVTVESTQDGVQSNASPVTVTTGPVANVAVTTVAGYTSSNSPVAAVRGSVTGNLATGAMTFVFVQTGY